MIVLPDSKVILKPCRVTFLSHSFHCQHRLEHFPCEYTRPRRCRVDHNGKATHEATGFVESRGGNTLTWVARVRIYQCWLLWLFSTSKTCITGHKTVALGQGRRGSAGTCTQSLHGKHIGGVLASAASQGSKRSNGDVIVAVVSHSLPIALHPPTLLPTIAWHDTRRTASG